MSLSNLDGKGSTNRSYTKPSYCLASFALICVITNSARAQTGTVTTTPVAAAADVATPDIWQGSALTGDWGGLRTRLGDNGFTLTATEIAETVGNVTGGFHRGFIFEGRFSAALSVDLEKAAEMTGALLYVDTYQIHGNGLTQHNLGNLFTVSNIEATRATRLHDFYFQQSFSNNQLSLRIGQIAADDEFIVSQYAAAFLDAMFGWPGLPSNDLSAGGPIYPVSTPGLRIKYVQSDDWAVMAAVFDGHPGGDQTCSNPSLNPQATDASGLTFNFGCDLFAIAELNYSYAPDKDTAGLPATYKLGAWVHSGKFANQRFDKAGRSLADPGSAGIPRTEVNDFSVYGVIDQMIWRRPGTPDRGLAGFVRAMGAPADRNLISYYMDAGLNYLGTFPGRDNDVAGLAIAYGSISNDLQRLDQDSFRFTGASTPVHDHEAVLELTYQAVITPWWSLQPDFEYVFHPGGNISNPLNSSSVIGDAAVFSLRTTIAF